MSVARAYQEATDFHLRRPDLKAAREQAVKIEKDEPG